MEDDGKIIIGTYVDDKDFYAKIREFEQTEVPDFEISPELNVEDLYKEILKANAELQKFKKLDVISQEELTEIQTYIAFIDKANARVEELGGKPLVIEGLNDANKNLKDIAESAAKIDLSNVEKQLGNIGNSIQKVTKKIGKMALAVFGIRSAFMFVRNAINTIANNDNQLKADIDYMKTAMAYIIEPIVRKIVELAKTLMTYIAYIVKAWTGRDIFASASKNLKKATSGAKALNKELNKSTASFDEMNILQNSSSSGGGGGAGTTTPDMGNIAIPGWVDTIAKAKDIISEILPIIVTIFAILTKTKNLGLYVAIMGIYKTFKAVKKWLKEPTFENFLDVLEGIALTVAGIAIALGAWPVAIVAALVYIGTLLVKHWDKIKEGINKAINWVSTTLHNSLGFIGDIIAGAIESVWVFIRSIFDNVIKGIRNIYDGIVKITKGDFIGGLKSIFGGLLDILTAPFDALINVIKNLWDKIKQPITNLVNKIKKALGFSVEMDYKFSAGGGGTNAYGSGGGGGSRAKGGIFYPSKLPKLAVGGIVNMPGRGVSYNGATIGERGAEAVVPLTDSQQMALLGEAIAKYVRIENIVDVNMDSRKINRILQSSSNRENFILNR